MLYPKNQLIELLKNIKKVDKYEYIKIRIKNGRVWVNTKNFKHIMIGDANYKGLETILLDIKFFKIFIDNMGGNKFNIYYDKNGNLYSIESYNQILNVIRVEEG